MKERTKTERRRAVEKLADWMQRAKLAGTVEAVSRRIAGRYLSEELLPRQNERSPMRRWPVSSRSLRTPRLPTSSGSRR
ncbi:MAG TPA: hypothetical protein VIY55_08800 [Acetobacteraceae bacterium]